MKKNIFASLFTVGLVFGFQFMDAAQASPTNNCKEELAAVNAAVSQKPLSSCPIQARGKGGQPTPACRAQLSAFRRPSVDAFLGCRAKAKNFSDSAAELRVKLALIGDI